VAPTTSSLIGLSNRYDLQRKTLLARALFPMAAPPTLCFTKPGPGSAVNDALEVPLARSRFIALKARSTLAEALLASPLDQLGAALEEEKLDSRFSHNGCSFTWRDGRMRHATSEPSQQQEQRLPEAQRAAIAAGSPTAKHGNPFWTIKLPQT
jgi:hypothetical protein